MNAITCWAIRGVGVDAVHRWSCTKQVRALAQTGPRVMLLREEKLQDKLGEGVCGYLFTQVAVMLFDHGDTGARQLGNRQQINTTVDQVGNAAWRAVTVLICIPIFAPARYGKSTEKLLVFY
jgi:hypothetical protein